MKVKFEMNFLCQKSNIHIYIRFLMNFFHEFLQKMHFFHMNQTENSNYLII